MQIRKFNDEDFIKYDEICKYMVFSLNVVDAEYYIYLDSNGRERVLCNKDNQAYYFCEGKDGKLDCRRFIYDNNGKIVEYTTSKYEVSVENNKSFMVDRNTGNIEMIKVVPIKDSDEDSNYNMKIAYSQYNRRLEENMILFYKYSKRDNYVLLDVMKPLDRPSNIIFQKIFNGEVIGSRQFILREYKEGEVGYDVLALREYGIKNYLNKRAFALHKSSIVGRYERLYVTLPFVGNITGFPLTSSYSQDDIRECIGRRGYNYMIPREAMKVFNNGYEDMDEIQKLAKILVSKEEKKLEKRNKSE